MQVFSFLLTVAPRVESVKVVPVLTTAIVIIVIFPALDALVQLSFHLLAATYVQPLILPTFSFLAATVFLFLAADFLWGDVDKCILQRSK